MGHLCFDLFDPGLDSSPDLNTVDGAGHNEMDVEWMNEKLFCCACIFEQSNVISVCVRHSTH